MPLHLPTDTAHTRLQTRQYELFNRPIGQGVPRRTLAIAAVVGAVWIAVMLLAGVSPLSRFGPMLWIVPPFLVVYFGTRADDTGRMTLLLWYDALLSRLPSRRAIIRNPLMDFGGYQPEVITIRVYAELRPREQTTSTHTTGSRSQRNQ